MTTKYFYKSVPIESLINNGNRGGPTPTTISPSYGGFPAGDADSTPFGRPFDFGITIGSTDLSTYFTAEFTDIHITQNTFVDFDKTIYNHIRGIFVGGGGGAGGGGDGGYGDTPTNPSRQRWGSSGGGGGGASYVYLNTLSIANENNYKVTIGVGGNGANSWSSPNGPTVPGNAGNETILYLSNSINRYLDASGGRGGQTGTSGSNNYPNSSSGFGGAGGAGGVSNTSSNYGQFTGNNGLDGQPSGPTVEPRYGGYLSNPTTNYPAIPTYGTGGNGGNAGYGSGVGNAGNAGNPGFARLYFLRQ